MARSDYIVIGMGRFGIEVAARLKDFDKNVAIMDKDDNLIQRIGNRYDYAVVLDSTDIEALRDFGVSERSTVIVAIGDLDPSIMTCSALLELGVRNIFVKAVNIAHKRILASMSLHNVIIPEIDSAKKIAYQSVFRVGIDITGADESHSVVKIEVNNPIMTDKPLKTMDLKKKYNLIIIAIIRGGKMILPYGESKLFVGDEVMFLIDNLHINKAVKTFNIEPKMQRSSHSV
ncbi:unnamed protein product [Didymodactylos carnosus]|uniref:RCK C-terminal domain-containing protein n=1 Tax=Didymodactylos carnosus TaxID=1234261 RepID=A0A8S2DCC4_9BILA|nr:unnamed protein product [Didymodactylos carnosus]CAF3646385.1 unnamed protein product [Didymodactylos carnosus]